MPALPVPRDVSGPLSRWWGTGTVRPGGCYHPRGNRGTGYWVPTFQSLVLLTDKPLLRKEPCVQDTPLSGQAGGPIHQERGRRVWTPEEDRLLVKCRNQFSPVLESASRAREV